MPVTDLLERNHKLYSDEVALVELNLEGIRPGAADLSCTVPEGNYLEYF